ncbi:PAS domain-containing sensor histidine kinase [Spirosoma aerophilum]
MSLTDQSAPIVLQSVLSASQNAVMVYQAVLNADGQATNLRLTMLNGTAEHGFGRPATELLGLTFDRLYPHLVGTGLDKRYLDVIETGQAARFEFTYTRPGLAVPAWCDVSAVALGKGSVVVSYTDISQYKADAHTARMAMVLQQTFDASPSAIIVFEAIRGEQQEIEDFAFAIVNKAGLDMMPDGSNQRETLLTKTLWQIYPGTHMNGLFEKYVQVCEQGIPLTIEHYFAEDKTWRRVDIVPVPLGVMVTYTDVTKFKNLEESSRQQAFELDELINHVPMGIAVLVAVRNGENNGVVDFQITRLNKVMGDLLVRPTTALAGHRLSRVIQDANVSGLLSRCVVALEEQQMESFDLPFVINKKPGWYTCSISPQGDRIMLAMTDISETKHAQLDYHQQAELVNSVLNGSQHAIVAMDAKRDSTGKIVDFAFSLQNKIYRELVSRSSEQLVGHQLLEIFPSVQDNGQLTQFVDVVTTGRPFRLELTFDFGKGPGWYDMSAVKHGDGLVLTIQDKTAQKQIEQRFEQQARLLKTITNNTPAGLVLWEAVRDTTPERNIVDFRYRMSNLMNTLVTGHPTDSLVGQNLFTLFPHFRGTQLEAILRETLATGRAQHMIFTKYTPSADGWLDAQFTRIGNLTSADEPFADAGVADSVLMTYIDVTEAHQVQVSQKKQADLLQLIMDNQPSGIVLFEPVFEESEGVQPGRIIDFVYKMVNETQRKLTGRTNHELLGKRLRNLFPSNQGQMFFEYAKETAETGQSKEWLMPFYSDGIQGWFQVSLTQHSENVLFTFLDVTELKKQQQALEFTNHELHRSNENLQKFAYVASHDLQEPLRKIQSFGSILATNYAPILDEAGQDIIERMQLAAYRMSKLIKHLLAYSRLNTHQLEVQSIKLTDLLRYALEELSVMVQESGATVQWGELPDIQGDPMQLRQLFGNLLSNAIKYRLPTVAPQIKVSSRVLRSVDLPRSVALPNLGVTSAETGIPPTYYEINITDNGIGFDEKYLDRIFQVFQRLHGKNDYAGTGIGLAICQKVAENHQGALTATSSPGKGATFSVYLPRLDTDTV